MQEQERAERRGVVVAATAGAGGLGLGVLYDVFFWHKPLGAAFAVYIALVTALFLALARWQGALRNRWALLFLVPVAALSADVVVYENRVVHLLAPPVVVLLWAAFSLWTSGQRVALGEIPAALPIGWVEPLAGGVAKFFRLPWRGLGGRDARTRLNEVAAGLLLALPLVVLFLVLFASADLVFRKSLESFVNWWSEGDAPWRVGRTVLLALAFAAYFYALVGSPPWPVPRAGEPGTFPPTVLVAMLAPLNGVFAAFLAVQSVYLFGGEEVVRSQGFTYAEYARRGFFELLLVSAITLAITTAGARPLRATREHLWSRTMLSLFVVLTFGVIASALKRLYLYEGAYGLTLARLYAHWIIICVAAGFALTLVGLVARWRFLSFAKSLTVLVIASITIGGSLDAERLVAQANVARHLGPSALSVDVAYLSSLSADAVPCWARLARESRDPAVRQQAAEALARMRDRIRSAAQRAGWQGLVLSRAPALAAVDSAAPRPTGKDVAGSTR